MASRPFTLAAPLLKQYPQLSARQIAQQVDVEEHVIYHWLKLLGIQRTRSKMLLHEKESGHCQTCGILLTEATKMDGAGDDTTCRYCLAVERGQTWREVDSGAQYGTDITAGVMDTIALAVERLGLNPKRYKEGYDRYNREP